MRTAVAVMLVMLAGAVALLAVLPEYAVDTVFAWKAGQDPSFAA